ncbi:uncharacterized protein LOC116268101 [Nymphaea colorata]|uniref:uncharacterized protein LOC116268101 n=1 Tax=Nymphaea colorata TaxID=210225 RepID=UPI00129DF266|nr:uncharacterized protein LOC116268101 [Nymphaea colorata]
MQALLFLLALLALSASCPPNCLYCLEQSSCSACKKGYLLTINATCMLRSVPNCRIQLNASSCSVCEPTFLVSGGKCVKDTSGCVVRNSAGACQYCWCSRCLNNFAPNALGICISSNCATFTEGTCVKCDPGFTLSPANLCIKPITPAPAQPVTPTAQTAPAQNSQNNPNSQITPNNPPAPATPASSSSLIIGCDLAINGLCVRCGTNFFPNNKGGCKRVIIGCITYDAAELNCVQCIPIYTQTSDGGCLYQPTPPPNPAPAPQQTVSPQTNSPKSASSSPAPVAPVAPPVPTPAPVPISTIDQNCLVRNNGSCAICKVRFVLNLYNFSCQPVPKECLTYNSATGDCLSCAQGFNLFQIWCLGRFNQTDPNCIIKDINNYCTTCQQQFYQSQGRCFPLNTQCKTANIIGGDCLSCYSGYIVIDGACVLLSQQPSCLQYDFQSNCVRCAQRYFLQSLICVPVSPLCNNYNAQTGVCIDCVAGYGISSVTNNCETVRAPVPNCQTADPVGNCLSCLNRFYFNTSNACLPVNPLCSKYVAVGGKCLACFTGHNLLSDSSCVRTNLATGCNAANANGLCSACSGQYVLTASGSCLWRDTNCLGYDDSGNCNRDALLVTTFLRETVCLLTNCAELSIPPMGIVSPAIVDIVCTKISVSSIIPFSTVNNSADPTASSARLDTL